VVLQWFAVSKRIKVGTNSSTEFGSNPILIDRIWIESAAGSNLILVVQIHTALDHTVDFNERVTVFTTGRACTPSSDIKDGHCLVSGTTPIKSTDATDASRARWLADHVVARCPINRDGCRRMRLIDSQKQPMSADDSGVACITPFVQCFTLSRFLMDVYFLTVHGRSLLVSDRYWIADSEAADFTGSVQSNFGWIVRPLKWSSKITQQSAIMVLAMMWLDKSSVTSYQYSIVIPRYSETLVKNHTHLYLRA